MALTARAPQGSNSLLKLGLGSRPGSSDFLPDDSFNRGFYQHTLIYYNYIVPLPKCLFIAASEIKGRQITGAGPSKQL